ncbi:ATP-binding protein [Dactylosporangium sp. NPDC000521]|uniref:ATP-binding protein n=1 Tax=Dactylosporangium sp. NPDC000521 TaxID=3363975 RepID=UPI0036AFD069
MGKDEPDQQHPDGHGFRLRAKPMLCIDELGYIEVDKRGAELLFQVLTEREENASVAIASNEAFSG